MSSRSSDSLNHDITRKSFHAPVDGNDPREDEQRRSGEQERVRGRRRDQRKLRAGGQADIRQAGGPKPADGREAGPRGACAWDDWLRAERVAGGLEGAGRGGAPAGPWRS